MKIIVAKNEDYTTFKELRNRFACLGTNGTGNWEITEEAFKEYANREGIWFAYEGETPIGYVAFTCYDDLICDLHEIFILPEWQKNGYGTNLVNKIIKEAKESGMTKVRVISLFMETDHYWMMKCRFRPDEEGYLAKDL